MRQKGNINAMLEQANRGDATEELDNNAGCSSDAEDNIGDDAD
jgi:hypothetical protein